MSASENEINFNSFKLDTLEQRIIMLERKISDINDNIHENNKKIHNIVRNRENINSKYNLWSTIEIVAFWIAVVFIYKY
jgi:hypothetical protein